MMNKLTSGRYILGDSFTHRLDPRTKLLASFYLIGIIFSANNRQSYVLTAVFTVFAISLSKVSVRSFTHSVRPLLQLILFTMTPQILFTQGGEVYFQWEIISIIRFGVTNGLSIPCRFVLIIFMSTLLTLTTAPLELSDTAEYLSYPLRVVRSPAHEVSLMSSTALRFVPTLMDETEKIMNAQHARGVDFGEGNSPQKMKAIVPLLIPLPAGSSNCVEDLATATEVRDYQGGEGRAKYHIFHWYLQDTTVMFGFVLLTIGLFALRTQKR